jgi:hypothetical protein
MAHTTLATAPRRPLRLGRAIGRGLGWAAGVLGGLTGLLWIGTQVPPAPFAPVAQAVPPQRAPLPGGLPAPVARFYRTLYGDTMPVVRTAVISGRATMRPVGGVSLPARFRFTHVAGQSYRHYFETTVYGMPIMRVNEHFVGGAGRMEMPWGVEASPEIDQAANLSMWAELAAWAPAALLADARVRWEPLDDASAVLVVPFGAAEDRFIARFDQQTGRLWLLESMRYKGSGTAKTLWLNEVRSWGALGGQPASTGSAVTWADDGKPWLTMTVEELAYNVPADTSLAARGP